MPLRPIRASALLLLSLATVGCFEPPPPVAGEPGTPLPGLTEAQLAQFELGRRWFDRRSAPSEGLGPYDVQRNCGQCHGLPRLGGTGVEYDNEFTHFDESGACDVVEGGAGPHEQESGRPPLQRSNLGGEGLSQATERVTLTPPVLYGLGMVEAVPEETVTERADPHDVDGDGISGRPPILPDGRLGRLGRKGGAATLRDLVAAAFLRERELTTLRYPAEVSLDRTPEPAAAHPTTDPEIDQQVVEAITAFLRFLVPPARQLPQDPSARQALEEGERVFHAIGCASCHVSTMRTGSSDIEALDRKTVALYSDMLLHDLGPDFHDICGPTALSTELRTARLMGLRYRLELLHDGRAETTERAIRMHGGEAEAASTLFGRLEPDERESLLRFLDSL